MPTIAKMAQLITALAAAGALAVSIANMFKIETVHISINSRMTELLELTQKASKAEGLKQGQEESHRPK